MRCDSLSQVRTTTNGHTNSDKIKVVNLYYEFYNFDNSFLLLLDYIIDYNP